MPKQTRKQIAFDIIREVGKAVIRGDNFLTYTDLSDRINEGKLSPRNLGPYLDRAAEICLEHDLPDVTANVVSKPSFDRGAPMPSDDSFVEGIWPISGVAKDDVPEIQKMVIAFDWRAVRQLGLLDYNPIEDI